MIEIQQDRLARLERLKLLHGSHTPTTESDIQACAMEMVSYLANEPWSDRPACSCPVLTGYVISLNDNWSDANRQRLKPFLQRLIGTRSTAEIETRRAMAALDWTMRIHRPIWLDAAGLSDHAAIMRALPEIVDEKSFAPAMTAQETAIMAALDALAALAALDALAAWTAWTAWAAWNAWAAWTAWTAWAAWNAWAAWTAWAAWNAWNAWDAIGVLVAHNAGVSLGPDATEAQRTQAGIAALESVAEDVRMAELELLDRMILIVPEVSK